MSTPPPGRRPPASRRSLETLIVRVVIAVIGLHVVDDNFLQPNPGTSASDHLLGGLVPLALLFGAALAYPRLRPFSRGVTAFLVGLFGIAAGLEGWYYSLSVGPSGDDFTGLVTLAGGRAAAARSPRSRCGAVAASTAACRAGTDAGRSSPSEAWRWASSS